MAINPETKYPGQITPSSPAYPYGQARNITSPNDGTGTPWEAALINDAFGFQQAILQAAGVVPSGSPETALVSQYLQSMYKIVGQRFDVLADLQAATDLTVGQYVFVNGRLAVGDGGANQYEIVAAATGTDDGGSYIDLAGSGLQARGLFPGGVVNVAQWGILPSVGDNSPQTGAMMIWMPAAGGAIAYPPGTYQHLSKIVFNKPIYIRVDGSIGSLYQPTVSAKVILEYSGVSTLEFVIFGANTSTTMVGGGLQGFHINGGSLADRALVVRDVQHFILDNLLVSGGATDGLYMTNTGGNDPTGFGFMRNIHIQQRTPSSSNGLNLNGVFVGNDGLTLCVVDGLRVDHEDGAGVKIGDIGDAFYWDKLFTFRPDVNTGFGVDFSSTNPAAICGMHYFAAPLCTAGFRFATAGIHPGTRIINQNRIDINAGSAAVFGPGAFQVQTDTSQADTYGLGMIPDYRTNHMGDGMAFARYDSANNLLHTAEMNWSTGSLNAVFGNAGQAGAAVELRPNAGAAGNWATIFTQSASQVSYTPLQKFMISLVNTTGVRARVGLSFDATADPASDGIYFEYDSSVDAFWHLVTRASGVETNVVTTLGAGAPQELVIGFSVNEAVFSHRALGNALEQILGTITTNIPVALLNPFCYVKTLDTTAKPFFVYDFRYGAVIEM